MPEDGTLQIDFLSDADIEIESSAIIELWKSVRRQEDQLELTVSRFSTNVSLFSHIFYSPGHSHIPQGLPYPGELPGSERLHRPHRGQRLHALHR